jgi:hypothetical protein
MQAGSDRGVDVKSTRPRPPARGNLRPPQSKTQSRTRKSAITNYPTNTHRHRSVPAGSDRHKRPSRRLPRPSHHHGIDQRRLTPAAQSLTRGRLNKHGKSARPQAQPAERPEGASEQSPWLQPWESIETKTGHSGVMQPATLKTELGAAGVSLVLCDSTNWRTRSRCNGRSRSAGLGQARTCPFCSERRECIL